MNEALKQKIVGIVVVTAVLVVLLPSLFDEPIQEEMLSHVNVAKQPPDLAIDDFVTIERERTLNVARQNIETVRQDDEEPVLVPDTSLDANTQVSTTQTVEPARSDEIQRTTATVDALNEKTTSQAPASGVQKNLPSLEIAQLREAVDTLMDKVTGTASQKTENKITHQAEPIVSAAWTIQLASFSEQGNAIKLRDTLLTQGEKSYLRRSDAPAGKVIYRVYVGPMLKDSDANAALERLKAKHTLKGILVKYMPE
jgi:cell division septation protein DedD